MKNYAIGPFLVDNETHRVTLAPGVYKLTKAITFGVLPETVVTGVEYCDESGEYKAIINDIIV